jgi:SAM-dependent methyltransferase
MALLSKRRARPPVLDAPAGVRILLHVGCGEPDPDKVPGRFRGPGWRELRLDIDPDVEPDIVGTIVDMTAVPSEAVDALWSSHNLEHVYAHEVPVVLREFHRVLRGGGEALILVPDLQKTAEAIATGNLEGAFYTAQAGAIAALDVVYGYGMAIAAGNEYMAHRTGFTAKTLERKLHDAGFARVKVERRPIALLLASARKPAPR